MNKIVQLMNKISVIGLKQYSALILSVCVHVVGISIIGITSVTTTDNHINAVQVDFFTLPSPKRVITLSKAERVLPTVVIPTTFDLYRTNPHQILSTTEIQKTKGQDVPIEIISASVYNSSPLCRIAYSDSSRPPSIQTQVKKKRMLTSSVKPVFNRIKTQADKNLIESDELSLSPLPLNLPTIDKPTQNASFLKKVEPLYPESAHLTHQQGIVVLEATIGTDGIAQDIRVVEVINVNGLGCEESAIQALKSSIFTPAMRGNVFISQRLRIPYRFSLKS